MKFKIRVWSYVKMWFKEIQPSFSNAFTELEVVLAVREEGFDAVGFINELKKFREVLLKQQQVRQQGLPQNINPMIS